MNLFECILYGLICGLTDILPVSSQAHSVLFSFFIGHAQHPLQRLFSHLGVLLAVLSASRGAISRIHREYRFAKIPARRRKRPLEVQYLMERKVLGTALIPLIPSYIISFFSTRQDDSFPAIALLLIINGLILFLPRFFPEGNKDARSFSALDSFLIGICSALSVFPGMSSIGASTSCAISRGSDRQFALRLALLLCIPVLILVLIGDLIMLFGSGFGEIGFWAVIQFMLGGLAAFAGALMAIRSMRFLSVKAGYESFAYYCWGLAFFVFILYLLIH